MICHFQRFLYTQVLLAHYFVFAKTLTKQYSATILRLNFAKLQLNFRILSQNCDWVFLLLLFRALDSLFFSNITWLKTPTGKKQSFGYKQSAMDLSLGQHHVVRVGISPDGNTCKSSPVTTTCISLHHAKAKLSQAIDKSNFLNQKKNVLYLFLICFKSSTCRLQ